jgi:hypothetical protein
MRNVSDESLYKTHFMLNKFFSENRAIYKIMWKKYSKAGQTTDDNITRHMCIARWVPKATNTHIEYAILIGFPLQHWLQERAFTLPFTYTASYFLYYQVNAGSEAPQLPTQWVPWIFPGDKFAGA